MSPRAVDKRARPGNDHLVRSTGPETASAVTAFAAAEHNTNRISQQKQPAKAP